MRIHYDNIPKDQLKEFKNLVDLSQVTMPPDKEYRIAELQRKYSEEIKHKTRSEKHGKEK